MADEPKVAASASDAVAGAKSASSGSAFRIKGADFGKFIEDKAGGIMAKVFLDKVPVSVLKTVKDLGDVGGTIAGGIGSMLATFLVPDGKKYSDSVESALVAFVNDVFERAGNFYTLRSKTNGAITGLPEGSDAKGMGFILGALIMHPQGEQILDAMNALGEKRNLMFWTKLSTIPEKQLEQVIGSLTPEKVVSLAQRLLPADVERLPKVQTTARRRSDGRKARAREYQREREKKWWYRFGKNIGRILWPSMK